MSAPSRPLVTIDDPITIIEPHRVLLEWVEIVERQGFRVRSRLAGQSDRVYRHDDEGTAWARGHHLPDSEVVLALRAAVSLDPGVKEKPALPPPPLSLAKAMADLIEQTQKAHEEEEKKKSWWQIYWSKL